MRNMIRHVDEGVLQALTDGELPDEVREGVERHLAGCAECRAELATLRIAAREVSGAVALLDRPRPRAASGPAPVPAARRLWPVRSLARAAALVLGFAAAASATIPGSPVRAWLWDEAPPEPRVAAVEAPPAPAASAPAAEGPAEAGVSVEPVRGEVAVVLRRPAQHLQVRARITDGPRAGVFATGDAAGARFSTGPGRIEVDGAGAGELRIELPRGARTATVMVDDRPYLSKQGDQLRLSVGGADSASAEVSFRIQP